MDNIIKELVKYVEKFDGKIVDTSDGFDGEFLEADMLNLPLNKYVLPYILFNGNYDAFLNIGEKCTQFNSKSKDNNKFIHWKVIVIEWDKNSADYCLSATTNRMDLHDPSVVIGLTKEKRSELLNISSLLFIDFLDVIKGKTQI